MGGCIMKKAIPFIVLLLLMLLPLIASAETDSETISILDMINHIRQNNTATSTPPLETEKATSSSRLFSLLSTSTPAPANENAASSLSSLLTSLSTSTPAPVNENAASSLNSLLISLSGNTPASTQQPLFWPITDFSEGRAFAETESGNIVCIDKTGRILFTLPEYVYRVYPYQNGLAQFQTNDTTAGIRHAGMLDAEGNVILFPASQRIGAVSEEGWFSVRSEVKQTVFLDRQGQPVFQNSWEDVGDDGFSEGLCTVMENGLWGYMDTTGTTVIPCVWESVSAFKGGLAVVENSEGLYGLINTDGDMMLDCAWESLYLLPDGWIGVENAEEKVTLIKSDGSFGLPMEYDRLSGYVNGVTLAAQGRRMLLLNDRGQTVAELNYDDYSTISEEGLICVEKEGKYGYIDTTGTLVIPCIYDAAEEFKGGLAAVVQEGLIGLINTSGETVVPFEWYDMLESKVSDGAIIMENHVTLGDIARCYDTEGHILFECGERE